MPRNAAILGADHIATDIMVETLRRTLGGQEAMSEDVALSLKAAR